MMAGVQTSRATAGGWLVVALCVSGCVAPVAGDTSISRSDLGPLRVTNAGLPFGMSDGALARKTAEAECRSRGRSLRSSIYDRFESGNWVFVEGCV